MADGEGGISGFDWGPDIDKDFRAELLEAARLLLVGMSKIDELFQLNSNDDLAVFSEQLGKLSDL
jgi:hypothetical protein